VAISDLAKAVADKTPWQTCAVCHAITTLPDAQAAALRELLANPSVRYRELSAALAADQDYPLTLRDDTLSRHARGECAAREKLRAA
jgi:hypothetical protein